jgi:hypothetical protein
MAKQGTNTFAGMSSTLRSLGFVSDRRRESVVFTYPNGGPVILLPAYKSGEVVKPIHLMMVQKQLVDAGLVKAEMVPEFGYATVRQKTKAASKSIIAKKSKVTVKPGKLAKRGHKLEA